MELEGGRFITKKVHTDLTTSSPFLRKGEEHLFHVFSS